MLVTMEMCGRVTTTKVKAVTAAREGSALSSRNLQQGFTPGSAAATMMDTLETNTIGQPVDFQATLLQRSEEKILAAIVIVGPVMETAISWSKGLKEAMVMSVAARA